MTNNKLHIAYSDDYLGWLLGAGNGSHPTKPIRAKIATEMLIDEVGRTNIRIVEPTIEDGDREALESIHDPKFVSEVIDDGISNDWYGQRTEMGEIAFKMFTGTMRLVDGMLDGEIRVGFNPQGAKHHAQYGWSEGFCVFNDFAWAAKELTNYGYKVAYVDWDVNAGDGVQNLLSTTDIPTFSIHGHGIYPVHSNTFDREQDGSVPYEYHNPKQHWYNYCLPQGSGDKEFAWAIDKIAEKIADYQPDIILLATGADAHEQDNWGIKFTYAGYDYASGVIADLANKYSKGRVLIGGAGGYKAYTATPRVWANVVKNIYTKTNEMADANV